MEKRDVNITLPESEENNFFLFRLNACVQKLELLRKHFFLNIIFCISPINAHTHALIGKNIGKLLWRRKSRTQRTPQIKYLFTLNLIKN